MTPKQIIVIFTIGLLVGAGVCYLFLSQNAAEHERQTEELNGKITLYMDTIAELKAENESRETYIRDLESHIEFSKKQLSELKSKHEKKVTVIRSLSPDATVNLLGANLSETLISK